MCPENPSDPDDPVCRLFHTPTLTPTLLTLPSPDFKAKPRSAYGNIVNFGSDSWTMPRNTYTDGKSRPPVKVTAPGLGSLACARATPGSAIIIRAAPATAPRTTDEPVMIFINIPRSYLKEVLSATAECKRDATPAGVAGAARA